MDSVEIVMLISAFIQLRKLGLDYYNGKDYQYAHSDLFVLITLIAYGSAHLITSVLFYKNYDALIANEDDPRHKKFGFYFSELALDKISKKNAMFAANLSLLKHCLLIYIAVFLFHYSWA